MLALFSPFVRWLRLSRVRALRPSVSLEEALERAHQLSMDRDLTGRDQSEVIAIHDAIRESAAWKVIVRTNLESIGDYGIIQTIECAVGMGMRLGIDAGRMLQSANAVKPQPTNESQEEHQQKRSKN